MSKTFSNLAFKETQVGGGVDDVIIIEEGCTLPGGRTLDVTGVSGTDVVKAGTVLVQNTTDKTVKPLPQTVAGTWDSLPDGYAYIGLLKDTVSLEDPRAAILVNGVVNGAAIETNTGAPITADIKAGLPHVQFLYI